MSIELLKQKLNKKSEWIKKRYDYYEQKNLRIDPSPVIPFKESWQYNATLGWCTKAVDSLANRLSIEGFDNDSYNFWNIFQMNNPDVFFDSAIRSALISACCFVYISPDEEGFPRLQVIDGKNATGTIDPITNLLKEGYAILETGEYGVPVTELYFEDGKTTIYKEGKMDSVVLNNTGYSLLVPIIYRPSANKPFGQSRISRDCIDIMDKARFCITRSEVTAEFGSIPQKYVLGLAQDAEFDTAKNTYKTMLAIDKDADGDKPTVGQFQQANLTPHLEQFRLYASAFAGATGLTVDDLGFVSENPSSAEAIRAGHAELDHIASKAQDTFGSGILNVGLVAASLRDDTHYSRSLMYETKPIWKPIFKMDNSAISSFGDGIIKINQAIPNAISAKTIKRMTGLPIEESNAGYNTSSDQ